MSSTSEETHDNEPQVSDGVHKSSQSDTKLTASALNLQTLEATSAGCTLASSIGELIQSQASTGVASKCCLGQLICVKQAKQTGDLTQSMSGDQILLRMQVCSGNRQVMR